MIDMYQLGARIRFPRSATTRGALLLLILAQFTACSRGPQLVSIGELHSNAYAFTGKLVTIEGTTTDAVNVFALRYFKLRDGTGEIIVLPAVAVPSQGQHVQVTGMIDQLFALDDKQFVLFVEEGAQPPEETMQNLFFGR